ncbi:conserved hypothetical protein [Deferribacter desulfuricans SSM1]|uniref:Nucleotidyltransferase n=1 Tax=Deferribacter desulfuricans (strain DSM 14783 / JCM 11476 / NBRC 101012 / SSM1) TaxID=639282 RepID=D3PB83_DEFDS|nr:hypothetical protein [Deferribacter desulfuricans]BAI79856.1 conserved hypothetical protein [Deferribacter desulfuricans SSM1]
MNTERAIKILCDNIYLLIKNVEWLQKSYNKALKLNLNKENLGEEDLEILETLSNRFGRTVDILINKVLRSLDVVELEDISRKLDIVIRAEKRGFVDDYRLLIALKDLKNEFAHEYIQENLIKKFKEIIEQTPFLMDVVEKVYPYVNIKKYCEQNDKVIKY